MFDVGCSTFTRRPCRSPALPLSHPAALPPSPAIFPPAMPDLARLRAWHRTVSPQVSERADRLTALLPRWGVDENTLLLIFALVIGVAVGGLAVGGLVVGLAVGLATGGLGVGVSVAWARAVAAAMPPPAG